MSQTFDRCLLCHAVLGVLRKHQQVIVGLLQAILNDPFCEWAPGGGGLGGAKSRMGGKSRAARPASAAAANPQALIAMAGADHCAFCHEPARLINVITFHRLHATTTFEMQRCNWLNAQAVTFHILYEPVVH